MGGFINKFINFSLNKLLYGQSLNSRTIEINKRVLLLLIILKIR